MNLTSPILVHGAQIYEWHSTQKHKLGTFGWTRDGRVFRYARAGAADLVVGNVLQAAAPVANHLALTPAAAAIGATSFTATLGATLATLNQYAEGWAQIDTTPGNGYAYPIDSHAAVAQSGVITAVLPPDAPIQIALTTASRVGFHANPYGAVIVQPTTATGLTVGAAVAPITALYYGWIQVTGPCPVLINGTPGVGIGVVISATTAGAVDVAAVAAEINVRIIGRMMQVGVSGKNNMVWLSL